MTPVNNTTRPTTSVPTSASARPPVFRVVRLGKVYTGPTRAAAMLEALRSIKEER